MMETKLADDLMRLLGVGNDWEFAPPLPPLWARRLRDATAAHPGGATVEIGWTLLGGIAGRTRWLDAGGDIVAFETVVPGAREQAVLALLGNPNIGGAEARALVDDCVRRFWSQEPYTLEARDELVRDWPAHDRANLERTVQDLEANLEAHRRRRQQWARLRGWQAPGGRGPRCS